MKPYASYKASGVDWLGDVPKHWAVKPVRYIAHFVKTGGTPPPEAFSDEPDNEAVIPWYAPSDITGEALAELSSRYVKRSSASEVILFQKETLALTGIGDIARCALLTIEATGNQQLNFIRFNDTVLPKYIQFAVNTGKSFIESRANKNLIPILNQEQTKRLVFPVPPQPNNTS